MKIDIATKGLCINSELYHFPLRIEVINKILGEPKLTVKGKNRRVVWKNTGLSGFLLGTKFLNQLDIELKEGKEYETNFKESLTIEGVHYKEFIKIKKEDDIYIDQVLGDLKLQIEIGMHEPKQINFITITPVPLEKLNNSSDKKDQIKTEKKKKPELPKPIKAEGEPIVFKDFNFKLLVIEDLMYFQEKLQPKFNIYDFAKAYTKRKIDIDEEGYDFIPEALEYFKKLEIDSKFAPDVVDLCQDGGNDVYMNIIPFWGGEDDSFDIKCYDDVDLFPNLKELTLFEEDEEVYKQLKAKGIKAEPI